MITLNNRVSEFDLSNAIHICFVTVGLATIEHIQSHITHLQEMGISYCLQFFPQGPFSDANILPLIAAVKNSIQIQKREDFLRHNQSIAGSKNLKILQSPYMKHYPLWLEQELAESSFGYLGYGITLSNWGEGHHGLPVFKKLKLLSADSVFSYVPMKARHWKSTKLLGNGLMQDLVYGSTGSLDRNDRILWAPHWSQSWFGSRRGYSRFTDALEPFFRYLQLSPEHLVTFRPHPILLTAIESILGDSISTNREVIATVKLLRPFEKDIRRLLRCPNLRMSNQPLTNDIKDHASLVTDGVSIIAYWAITGKPMVIWRDKESPKFNATGNFLTALFTKVSTSKDLYFWLVKEKLPPRFVQVLIRRVLPTVFAVSDQPPIIKLLKYI